MKSVPKKLVPSKAQVEECVSLSFRELERLLETVAQELEALRGEFQESQSKQVGQATDFRYSVENHTTGIQWPGGLVRTSDFRTSKRHLPL